MPSMRTPRVIRILIVAAFVVILNETTMNVALSRIMEDFSIPERTAQWLTTAFMLTMAVVIPVTGWLLERLPTRAVFLLAMAIFCLGTLVCAIAPAFWLLLVGRVIQASGTAIMMPLLMTTIMQLVPEGERGAMMGNISLVIAMAPALGPTLSGVILSIGSWRLIFLIVLPIGLLTMWLGHRRLESVNEPTDTPLDWLSVLLTALGFGPLVYGLSIIGADVEFWLPPLCIGVGLGVLVAFTTRQLVLQGRGRAFLDLRTLTRKPFTVSLIMLSLAMMALFGTLIMLPLLLQRAYGLSSLHVGLMLLPGGLAMGLLAPTIGRAFDRWGPRPLVIPASFAVLGVFLFLAGMSLSTPWWAVMCAHIVLSLGFAALFTPLITVALGSLPRNLYSHGSAVVGASQQVSGAAGTALFVTVFAMQTAAAESLVSTHAEAMLGGSHWAFLGAGAVWTGATICGFFVSRTDAESVPAVE